MSIFRKMLSRKPSVGTHPDSALSTTERGEAHTYIRSQYKCPHCGKQGSKDIRGRASVGRKMPNSKCHAYDTYNVLCGCGQFSTFWSDSSSWLSSHTKIVDVMCKPNGKCHFISGSGQLPRFDRSLFE
jgi:hypothetical protein